MGDIATLMYPDGDGRGLYVTRYRNPNDGREYVGPEILADSRAHAEEIVALLSYSGQPLTIDGRFGASFPADLADPDLRRELEELVRGELDRIIKEAPRG